MMNKKYFFFFFLGLFLINFGSALEFDNVKNYDEVKREVTITNAYGLGADIGKARLNTPLNVKVGAGYQKVAEFDLWAYEDYNDILKQFTFTDMKKKEEINREFDLKYLSYEKVLIDDYETKCSDVFNKINKSYSQKCENILISSHYETQQVWKKITSADMKKNDKLTIGIFVDVQVGDYVDWIPTIYGVEIEEWATWEGDIKTSLISYWNFDADANDSHGSNNGTVTGATLTTGDGGKIGEAYDFDGAGDWINTGIVSDYIDYSLGAWIRPDTLAVTTSDGQSIIWADVPANFGWGVGIREDSLRVMYKKGFIDRVDYNFSVDTWYHIMVTFDISEGEIQTFVNGVSIQNNSVSFVDSLDTNFYIGSNQPASPVSDFNGKIDEVGIWQRPLTQEEITFLYNNGAGLTYGDDGDILPNITLNSPSSANYTTHQNITINFSASDDINLQDVKLYVNDVLNQTNATGINNTNYLFNLSLDDGDYTIYGKATDNESQETNSSSIRIIIHTTAPTVNITVPTIIQNGTGDINGTLNYNISEAGQNLTEHLAECWYVYPLVDCYQESANVATKCGGLNTGSYEVTGSWSGSGIPLYDGNWDSSSIRYGSTSSYIDINYTIPVGANASSLWQIKDCNDTINLTLPSSCLNGSVLQVRATSSNYGNRAYFYCLSDSGWQVLRDLIIETCGIYEEAMWWKIGTSSNYSVNCSANTTNFLYQEGKNSISVFASDIFGNVGSDNAYFSYIEETQANNPDTIAESFDATFNLTINSTNIPTTTATLIFNNTIYTPTITTAGTNGYYFEVTVPVPEGWGNTSGIVQDWFWNYTIDGIITNESTDIENITVYELAIDNCSSYGELIFNFSILDEEELTFVNESETINFEADLILTSKQNSSQTISYSNEWASNNNPQICIPNGVINNSQYWIDLTVGYSSTDHVWEFFHIDSGTLNSTKIYENFNGKTNETINLMDLLTVDSTSFLFNYFDVDGLAVDGSIVHVMRKYIGNGLFTEVERAKSDQNGDTIIHLVEEDVIYYFMITLDGVLLYASSEYTALCQTTPCTIQIEASGGSATFPTDWDLIDGGAYDITSPASTRNVTLTYISNESTTMNLTIYKYNSDGSYSAIDTASDTGTSGTMTLTIPQVAGNVSFFASVRQDGEFINSEWVDFEEDARDRFGVTLAVFLGALIILTLGLFAVSEGVGTIVYIILGIIISGALGLIITDLNTGVNIVIYLVLAGGILLWKLTGRRS